MKNFLLFLLLNCFSLTLFAQPKGIQIIGQVTAGNNQPVEFATVMIADKATGTPIAGTTTDETGMFSVMAKRKDFYIEITFIGYAAKKITEFSIKERKVDLGTISLSEDSEMLDEVEVRAERSQTEFKLDKRVFNVGKDLSSTGASALEVLNNVPSVNVDIEGAISLRGSQGVQILINGKPSVIANEQGGALGTITADMIESVEVITNPSAKYEAEGTSGIINIVLKKEERKGMNGSFTINTGVPHNHSFGLSLNRRTEKFNLFSQLGVGYRVSPRDTENINRNLDEENLEFFNTSTRSTGFEDRNELFYNVILGTDYHINKRNVITLSGSFAYEVEDQPSSTDFIFQDANGQDLAQWNRSEVTEATNPKYQYELQYKKDFKDHKEHTLIISALGSLFAKDQSSEFFNRTLFGDRPDSEQRTRTDFKDLKTTFKLDYNKPFANGFTVETGLQYVLNEVSNDFEVSDFTDGIWLKDPLLTDVFEYNQNVLGVYATGAYEGPKWGLKLGLRVENTDLVTELVSTNQKDPQNFTDLFPTLHTSYKINEKISLQAGYSRRVSRPRLWSLNPFFNPRNPANIRKGNPDLLPEYTDSYEITSIYLLGKLTANFGVYHRYTQQVVEYISIVNDNSRISQPFNLGTNNATGVELNLKYLINKKISFTGDLNYNYFSRDGEFQERNFDFDSDQLSAKLTGKFKLPAGVDFEVTGQYRSKVETVQGFNSANLFADFGIRKKLFKKKGVISLSVRDVFASRFRERVADRPALKFYSYDYGIRGRFIALGFSYGFGKGEAMEFSGRRRRR